MGLHLSFCPQVDYTLVRALREHLQSSTGRPVALVETHISWVLLTEGLAYKLKKPVGLPFVDFSTLAVCMRRFPPGALLSEMLDAGPLQAGHMDRLAQRLADFHRNAPSEVPSPAFGMPEQELRAVLDVLAQLGAPCGTARIAALRVWVIWQAQALHDTWLARRRDEAVRECHGDLHLANAVRLGEGVTAFNCIEFDPALRWIDVMGDVACAGH